MTIRLADLDPQIRDAVARTRQKVSDLHQDLPANNLVVWTAGNVSERVPGADLFVIKPSGVLYRELVPENMVVCTLDGTKIDDGTPDNLQPSRLRPLPDGSQHHCVDMETVGVLQEPRADLVDHLIRRVTRGLPVSGPSTGDPSQSSTVQGRCPSVTDDDCATVWSPECPGRRDGHHHGLHDRCYLCSAWVADDVACHDVAR
ncbi:class II aldolase/adducin family protein [Acidipropionibacterium timonense]|uniref:class II aldolase/adducin family protein n=1 Tax=Acidipropionibacterium timonense TaxID=2161818 RepID=UPI00103150FD|nr:class II aldolase/adducin family protein [Acidipropionibacterium timonense]